MFQSLNRFVHADLDRFGFSERQRRVVLRVLEFSYGMGKGTAEFPTLEELGYPYRISKGNVSEILGELQAANVLVSVQKPDGWYITLLPFPDGWGLEKFEFSLSREATLNEINERGLAQGQGQLLPPEPPGLHDARVQVSIESALQRAKLMGKQGLVPDSGTRRTKTLNESERANEALAIVPESGTIENDSPSTRWDEKTNEVPDSGTNHAPFPPRARVGTFNVKNVLSVQRSGNVRYRTFRSTRQRCTREALRPRGFSARAHAIAAPPTRGIPREALPAMACRHPTLPQRPGHRAR